MIERFKHYLPPEELINDILDSARELEVKTNRQQVINAFRAISYTIEKYDQQEQESNAEEQQDITADEENIEGDIPENMPGGMDGGSLSELSSDKDQCESDGNNGAVDG